MKNKITVSIAVVLLVVAMIHVTLNFAPAVLSDPGSSRREVWKVVTINNPQVHNTSIDVNITVNSRKGVYIACSPNVTDYFANLAYWQTQGYPIGNPYGDYWYWLDGTNSLMYHWGEMDWFVSNGSLTPISYNDIQQWGDMYFDSGGSVNYTTFMGNTFMADWNLSRSYNDPDIVYQAYWQGNQIRMINGLRVNGSSTINIVFDIVMTDSGSYTFDVTTTPGVEFSPDTPSTWTVGGASTVLVPIDYPTVQAAVNAASSGDTIIVSAGTYSESQILITKPLTMRGEGAGPTIIDGGDASLSECGLVRIVCDTGNVTFSGFTLRNAGGPPKGSFKVRVGIYAQASVAGPTYTITNNTIYGTNNPDEEEDYGLYSYTGLETLIFRYNRITQTGANAILLEKHAGATDVSYNTLDEGSYGSTVYFSMTYGDVNVTTLQTVSYNTIDMGTGSNVDPSYLSGAITFNSASHYGTGNGTYTNVRIVGNTIGNLKINRRGISLVNDATGDGSGGDINSAVVSGNSITGTTGASNRRGIQLVGLVTNANISYDTVINTDTSFYGAVGIYGTHYAVGASITMNNFADNSLGLVWQGPATLNARYDWWGNESGPHNAMSQYPSSPGDDITGNVAFEPWLVKPYPPSAPITVVYVAPQSVTLETPALGTGFNVNVTVANASMMYGFQFRLRWDTTLLNLTSYSPRVPTVWGTNYISQSVVNYTNGNYSLFMSAKSPAPPFNGTTTVALFTFKSILDPVYDNNVTCGLTLEDVKVADINATSLLRLIYNGTYSCNSVKPKLLFREEYVASKVPREFDAYINITNVVNLNNFSFTVAYDTYMLTVLYVNASTFSGTPIVLISWNPNTGEVFVNVTGISPPTNGSMVLAKVRFKVERGFVWSTETPAFTSGLNFTAHVLNNGLIVHDVINGTYTYRPVPGDLNRDGQVDIVDLMTVAGYFSQVTGIPYVEADLNHDGVIDILDIILVARNFGRTAP